MATNLHGRPVSKKTCVLYDPQNGSVVHTHSVVVMPGGRDVTDQELEERAKDRAKRAGHDIANLRTLPVAAEDCDGSSMYRVDLTTRKLHKLERPVGKS